MNGFSSDRNLLLGIVALQMDFISRDELIAAMHGWTLDKTRSLSEILVRNGALDPTDARSWKAWSSGTSPDTGATRKRACRRSSW